MHRSVISVVIPAYNEGNSISNVISETALIMDSLKMPYEIIVVDDGSTDKTRQVATLHKATVLSNGRNRGKGYAIRKGFKHAQGDIIVTLDSDGSHSPKEIPSLIEPLLNGVDITAGSRFLGNGKHFTTRINRLGNALFNFTILTLTGKRVTDSQTGFRAFKKEFLQHINLKSEGYEIETEITVKGLKNGFEFKEIPVSCTRRMFSRSRLRILSDGIEIFKTIFSSTFNGVQ